jgi:cytochrome c-type biogenesis protein CcmH/NrfG
MFYKNDSVKYKRIEIMSCIRLYYYTEQRCLVRSGDCLPSLMRLVIAQVVVLAWRMFLLMLFVLVGQKRKPARKEETQHHHTSGPSEPVDLSSRNEAQPLKSLISFISSHLFSFAVNLFLNTQPAVGYPLLLG